MIWLAIVTTRRELGLRKTEQWQKRKATNKPFRQYNQFRFFDSCHSSSTITRSPNQSRGLSSRASSKQVVVPNQLISASNVGKWVIGEQTALPSIQANIQVNLEELKDPLKDKFIFDNLFSVSAASKNMCNKISDNFNEIVKGRLKENYKYREQMGANKNVLDIIKVGYKLPFLQTPKPSIFSNNKSSSENHDFCRWKYSKPY